MAYVEHRSGLLLHRTAASWDLDANKSVRDSGLARFKRHLSHQRLNRSRKIARLEAIEEGQLLRESVKSV